jgi:hypothetical protein
MSVTGVQQNSSGRALAPYYLLNALQKWSGLVMLLCLVVHSMAALGLQLYSAETIGNVSIRQTTYQPNKR